MNRPTENRTGLDPADARLLCRAGARADANGALHPRQQALIHRRGWLRLLAPRRDGGAECPLPDAVRLYEAISRADGSCGWVVTLCSGAGWFAGFWPSALAREVIGTRRVCLSGSGASSGVAEREGAGWRISGQWRHATGAPMATHFTFNALLQEGGRTLTDAVGAPRSRAFVVPASAVTVLPDWNTVGLRATRTDSFRLEGVWVPDAHGFELQPGVATAEGPLYRFPFLPFAWVSIAANIGGMAARFTELAGDTIMRRRDALSGALLGDNPAVHAVLALHQASLGAAREAFYRVLEDAWRALAQGAEPQTLDAQALRAASLGWVAAARAAVDALYPLCGLHGADLSSELNRVWRDFHTGTQHALLLPA